MLKILGFFRSKRPATETSFELPEHYTISGKDCSCLLETVTTRERINLKVLPAKSSRSLSVTYQKTPWLEIGDLAGHIFPFTLCYLEPQVLDREIPKQFLVTEETFRDHITMVLSETCLPSSIQECLPAYISKLEVIKRRRYRRGFMIEVEVIVEEYNRVHIGSCCKGREACPGRWLADLHVPRKVTGTDCAICLTELSGAVDRMELWCSHVFHSECLNKWLDEHIYCPICRAEAARGTAFIY